MRVAVIIAMIVTMTHVTRKFGNVRSNIVAIRSSAAVPSIVRSTSIAIIPMTVTRRMAMAIVSRIIVGRAAPQGQLVPL